MKVFLGGTVADSSWRDQIIPKLKVDYFNPVVPEWNEKAYQQELYERENCEYCLYVLTPKMEGWYAIAEVVDDSYKRPDRTIFCFIEKDKKDIFTEAQKSALNHLGVKAERNGATWLKSLDEVVEWLNSANKRDTDIFKRTDQFNTVFISYGRKHSLHFARYFHDRLVQAGKKVWFDMNNIPLAVDFQEQIDDGIEKADNFIFIISPHSVKSEYCLKEIVLALRYNKRIIPFLHVEPSDCWDKVHPSIGKRNWLYMRQSEELALQNAHRQLSDKQVVPISEWQLQDEFDTGFSRFLELIDTHRDYVRSHTLILHQALRWDRGQRRTNRLLIGEDRKEAEAWLLTNEFYDKHTGKPVLPPSTPSELQSSYIVESKKNANNLLTDVFVSYSVENRVSQEKIIEALGRHAITSWVHSHDIEKGTEFESAIKQGIEQADNFLFFITKESVNSPLCAIELDHAQQNNKRIIPLMIEQVGEQLMPAAVRKLQYIDFTMVDFGLMTRLYDDEMVVGEELKQQKLSLVEKVLKDVEHRKEKPVFERKIDELVVVLHKDEDYYNKHKVFLVQAIKWKKQNNNESILLRGYNLENSKIWIQEGRNKQHKPLPLHQQFISESDAKKGLLRTDVFISYSRKDSDFARKLNDRLQIAGKNTWFDQESIASAVEFQKEIFNGIEIADNFLFIISEDAVSSPYCEGEIQHAVMLNKRFITILCRQTEPNLLPNSLKNIQWIDFANVDFNLAFNDVLRTLDTDRGYVQSHTLWSQKAIAWKASGKDDALLLRGSEYAAAKKWESEAIRNSKSPLPTEIHREFIAQSGSKERSARIVRWLSFVGILLLLLSSTMGFLAWRYALESQEQQKQILLEKMTSDSLRNLAELEKQNADSQRLIAIDQSRIAIINENLAKTNERLAGLERDKALRLKLEADNSKNQAVKDKQLAESLQKISYIDDYNDPIKGITEAVSAYLTAGDVVTLPVIRALAKSYYVNFDKKNTYSIGKTDISAFTPDARLLLFGRTTETGATQLVLWDVENAKDSASFKTNGQVKSIAFEKESAAFILEKPAGANIISPKSNKRNIDNIDYNRRDLSPDELRNIYYQDEINPFLSQSSYSPYSMNNTYQQQQINKNEQINQQQKNSKKKSPLTLLDQPQEQFDIMNSLTAAQRNIDLKVNYELWDIKTRKLITKTMNYPPVYANISRYFAVISSDTLYISDESSYNRYNGWRYGKCIGFYRALISHRNYIVGKDSSTIYLCENAILKDSILDVTAYDVQTRTRYVVIGNKNGEIKAYKTIAGSIEFSLQPFNTPIRFLKLSPKEKYLIVRSDTETIIWNRMTSEITKLKTDKPIERLIFSPDDAYMMITHPDGDASIIETNQKQTVLSIPGNGIKIINAAIAENFTYSILREDGTLSRSPIDNGIRIYKGHTNWLNDMAVSEDNRLLITASMDNSARVWDMETGKQLGILTGHTNWINSVDISPAYNRIVTGGSDKKVILWDLKTFSKLKEFEMHDASVLVIKVSPDGKSFLSGSEDKALRVTDFEGNAILHWINKHAISAACFSPNGQMVALAGKDHKIVFVDIKSKKALNFEIMLNSNVNDLTYTRDGKLLLVANSDGSIMIYNTLTYKLENTLLGHKHSVTSIVESPNGKYYLSSSWDKTAKLWDASTKTEIITIGSHNDFITSALFSPNGKYIITSSADRTAKRWLSIEGVVEWIQERHQAQLNP